MSQHNNLFIYLIARHLLVIKIFINDCFYGLHFSSSLIISDSNESIRTISF